MPGRTAALVVLADVAVTVVLLGLSMSRYPGGTWCHRESVGHAFWGNFLCDLVWGTSLGGRPNPTGSRLGELAMVVLALGIGLFFLVLPVLFPRKPRAGRLVRVLGVTSVAFLIAVALMPSERFGDLHGLVVFLAAFPALVASIAAVVALAVSEQRPRVSAFLGAAVILAAVVDLAMYAYHFAHRSDCAPLLPAIQKVALAFLLAWMTVSAARVLRARETTA